LQKSQNIEQLVGPTSWCDSSSSSSKTCQFFLNNSPRNGKKEIKESRSRKSLSRSHGSKKVSFSQFYHILTNSYEVKHADFLEKQEQEKRYSMIE
jgi:hypothetical protein